MHDATEAVATRNFQRMNEAAPPAQVAEEPFPPEVRRKPMEADLREIRCVGKRFLDFEPRVGGTKRRCVVEHVGRVAAQRHILVIVDPGAITRAPRVLRRNVGRAEQQRRRKLTHRRRPWHRRARQTSMATAPRTAQPCFIAPLKTPARRARWSPRYPPRCAPPTRIPPRTPTVRNTRRRPASRGRIC